MLADVRARIALAAQAAGRDARDVTLVAVTKFRPVAEIAPLIAQDQRVFGENRVQDALEKFPALREMHSDLRVHLIGQLQTNKVRDAVRVFDVIETVDRENLAHALGGEMCKQNRHLPCLIQVNTGEEPQKGGVAPRDLESLYRIATEEAGLKIQGLMCIPPAHEPPEPHFSLLRQLAGGLSLPLLSMGMSADFEAAIRHGATHVRVGSALFGA